MAVTPTAAVPLAEATAPTVAGEDIAKAALTAVGAYKGRGYSYRRGYGRGYYGGGLYFGYAAPYAYGPGACGYYDAWGYWHPYPACYAPYPYGY